MVKIPCDDNLPYTELSIPIEPDRNGDQLPEMLRIFFNQGSVVLSDVKDAAAKQFANQDVNISQNTIDKLSKVGSVETFPLSHPSKDNLQRKVAFYLDEVGQLKKLPPNRRAAQLASECGFKDVPLVGDIFVGRTGVSSNSNSIITNLDFELNELSSDACWMKDLAKKNYEHGIATNRVAMESSLIDESAATASTLSDFPSVKWSETNEQIELSATMPVEIIKFTTKDIDVKICPSKLSVKVRNNTNCSISITSRLNSNITPLNEWIVLLEGNLEHTVSVDDSTWCINGRDIELSLEKTSSRIWKKLLITA